MARTQLTDSNRMINQDQILKIIVIGLGLFIVGVIVVRILKPVIAYFENWIFKNQTERNIARMREANREKKPIVVRKTDNSRQMTRDHRQKYQLAQDLVYKGQVKEAAHIFESINFQRNAVNVLEAAGFIDEACDVLKRLNAIGRAGAIYERHQMLEKAAYCYTHANQHESAGKMYCRMAKSDYRYFVSAYEAFARDSKWDAMLSAASEVLATSKIVEVALTCNKSEFLGSYLANSKIAEATLPLLSDDQVTGFFTTLPRTPKFVAYAQSWAEIVGSKHLDDELLKFVSHHSELCDFFWSDLKQEARERLMEVVKTSIHLSSEVRGMHLQCLGEQKAA